MKRFVPLALAAWFGAACAKPGHVVPAGAIESQRTVEQVTYAAALTTRAASPAIRAVIRVKNESRTAVEFRLELGCPLHIQLRAAERSVADTAVWDSRGARRGWECTGGAKTVSVQAGERHELFTEVAIEELNASLARGSYDVFVQPAGSPSPGWLYAGRVTIPLK